MQRNPNRRELLQGGAGLAVGLGGGAGVLTGARGSAPVDLAAVAALAAGVGTLLGERGLGLIELNPVLVTPSGAVAVDAVAHERVRLAVARSWRRGAVVKRLFAA